MDLSKLPRMSHTPSPPAEAEATKAGDETGQPVRAESVATPDYAPADRQAGLGLMGEAWLSIAIGAIVILLQHRCLSWFSSKWFGSQFTWTFSDARGPLAYPDTFFYGHDLGLVLFGVALVLDGVILFTRRRALVMAALAMVGIATLWNLYTLVHLYTVPGFGFQFFPAIAVAVGVYIFLCLWRQVQVLRG